MSVEKKLHGVIPPMMSPVDKDQNIDETGARNIVNRCIRLGVSGLFVLGSMGEGQSITKEQRKRLIEITVDEAKGRVPILAGVSAEGSRKVMENTEDALLAGADYIVSLTPYFFGANDQAELITYFRNLARNISKPLVIYNNPGMTGNVITFDTFRTLSEEKNIVGVKNSSSDFSLHMQLIREFENDPDFTVFSGVEQMADAAMIAGSDGIVPGIATLIPDVFVGIYNSAKAGNLSEAKKLQTKALQIMDEVYLDGFWAWVAGQKYALSCLGLCQEYVTLDNRYLNAEEKARVKKALSDFNIKA